MMIQTRLFPAEVTSGVPKVILTGHECVLVEQHRGLIRCERECISLQTDSGVLTIGGSGLLLRRYSAEEAVVGGMIDSITLHDGGER